MHLSTEQKSRLHKINIKLPENRILYASIHLYECSKGNFKIMLIYQTDDNSLLQIKEKISLIDLNLQ